MKKIDTIKNGLLIKTNLLIAQAFGKRPSDVKRAIHKLECPFDFHQRNFRLAFYVNAQSKPRPCYEIRRDGFLFLVMGFRGKSNAD
jgi:Rha family phage regulatory protein